MSLSARRFGPLAAVFLLIPLFQCGRAFALSADGDVRLLFSDSRDVIDPWGKLHFGATPMQKIRDCKSPGFSLACCLPQTDGTWEVYGQVFQRGPDVREPFQQTNSWKLVHATTRDGTQFENVETVYEGPTGPWSDHLGMTYSPDAKEFLAIKLKMDRGGFAYRAFFGPDGRHWREHPGNPLFYDGDSLGLFWSESAHRFICTAKTLQPFLKHIKDHGGTHPQLKNNDLRDRRVLAIRSSPDGRAWEPSASLVDVWNRNGNYQQLPPGCLTTPDDQDPPDMEFYRGIGFWHHDRGYMVVLNYAASPLARGKHAPQLDTEWWVSRNGLRWDRPYRGTNALGDAFPGVPNITHNPMIIGDMMLFHFGNQLFGVKRDRISYLGARANGEFTTASFEMPRADLCLNAAVPSPERPFAAGQAYVMAAVLDDRGQPVPGFESEKCVVKNADGIDLPLRWDGKSARELAGRKISLRLYLRGANIYGVTSGS